MAERKRETSAEVCESLEGQGKGAFGQYPKEKEVEERKGKIIYFFYSNSEKWPSLALLHGITFVRAETKGLLGRIIYY